MYGYENDDLPISSGRFGLNAGTAKLTKFEWINNAGKDGAEMEAFDIQFTLEGGGRPLNYRLFPVTKAFGKDNVEITDPKAPEFQKALKDFNSVVTHILHTFIDLEDIKAALSVPITSFKEFCVICMKLLPDGYDQIPLDIFLQYQWQVKGEAKKTYLEVPKSMRYGRWLSKAVAPEEGEWTTMVHPSPSSDTPIALKYVDGKGNVHPFVRNGWFMLSNFAKQQIAEEDTSGADENFKPADEGEQTSEKGAGW